MAELPKVGQDKTNSTRTVTIACKLPHGLKMRVFSMVDTNEPVSGGGYRSTKVAHERGEPITLNGWSHPQNEVPFAQMVGGFALTPGVPKEFWDLWLVQNKDSDMVKNGLIFAHEGSSNTEADAKDRVKVKSGLERLDPANLPRGLKTADTKSL